jgi:hypothetical protein
VFWIVVMAAYAVLAVVQQPPPAVMSAPPVAAAVNVTPIAAPRPISAAPQPVQPQAAPPTVASAARIERTWRVVRAAMAYSCKNGLPPGPSTTTCDGSPVFPGDTLTGTQYGDWVATWSGWIQAFNLQPVSP